MRLTSALLFVVSANIDCLAIGLSYGIKAVKINYKSNVFIAIISCLGTLISMSAGTYLAKFISIKAANIMGCIILIGMGVLMLYQYIQERFYQKKTSKSLEDYDQNKSGEIEGKEVFILACGLAINNMGLGIGASITGIPIFLSCCLTFVVSLIFIQSSQYLGKTYISKRLNQIAPLISAILIIALGIYELFL
ncbi:MAG: manganese efflux pump [Coprobacillus sp.]